MVDSGSAEAADCSMLPTAATICLYGIGDPEQIRHWQVIQARVPDLRSVARVEVGTCQVPVISGEESAAFSRHVSDSPPGLGGMRPRAGGLAAPNLGSGTMAPGVPAPPKAKAPRTAPRWMQRGLEQSNKL
jgi:hypothetical protein